VTKKRFAQIGLDRLIRLAWLEKTVSLVLAGNDASSIKSILQADLQGSFRSSNIDVRGSIDKTITILLKVWLTAPRELELLRVEGLELLKRLPPSDRLVVHWGMVMAVYPFWSSVAIQVGRLLRLQGSVAATHIQRRMREQYGERETVSRRTRYALRSYLDWGVLQETGIKGVYSAGATMAVDDDRLFAWLTEASLHARVNGSAPLKDLLDGPSFFPFQIKQVRAETLVGASARLDLIRHGLDDDLVMLRKWPTKGARHDCAPARIAGVPS
jgi:hypothetical protein